MNIKNVPTWCKISIAIFLMFIYISLVFGVSAFVNGYCNNNNTINCIIYHASIPGQLVAHGIIIIILLIILYPFIYAFYRGMVFGK